MLGYVEGDMFRDATDDIDLRVRAACKEPPEQTGIDFGFAHVTALGGAEKLATVFTARYEPGEGVTRCHALQKHCTVHAIVFVGDDCPVVRLEYGTTPLEFLRVPGYDCSDTAVLWAWDARVAPTGPLHTTQRRIILTTGGSAGTMLVHVHETPGQMKRDFGELDDTGYSPEYAAFAHATPQESRTLVIPHEMYDRKAVMQESMVKYTPHDTISWNPRAVIEANMDIKLTLCYALRVAITPALSAAALRGCIGTYDKATGLASLWLGQYTQNDENFDYMHWNRGAVITAMSRAYSEEYGDGFTDNQPIIVGSGYRPTLHFDFANLCTLTAS